MDFATNGKVALRQINKLTSRRVCFREGNSLKVMAIAAAISVPLTSPTRRSLTSFIPHPSSPSSILKLNSLREIVSPRIPRLSLSAAAAASSSMSVEAAEKASPASFLDRRESGILHFVKYHGLGNDFILVSN